MHIFPQHLINADNTLEELVGLQKQSSSTYGRWGCAPIHTVIDDNGVEKSIIVPQDINYAHRGEGLKHLNLLEYCCLIQVIPRKGISTYKTKVQNMTYNFHSCHPLAKTHLQQVRSKMYIAVLAGGPPPEMKVFDEYITELSDLSSKTRNTVTNAARFYLTLLSPWTLQDKNKDT